MDTSSEHTDTDGPGLSEDQIFTLLAMPRRRELLRALDRAGGSATVGDLTTELAGDEHGADAGAPERKTVYVSLYQTHIPRMAAAGVVEYDRQSRTVTLTHRGRLLLSYLRFDPAREPGLIRRFLGRRKRAT